MADIRILSIMNGVAGMRNTFPVSNRMKRR
jgi:hypothetical protein